MSKMIPNPGSKEALRQNCRCPILDNEHGKGYQFQMDVFVISENCPLHTIPAWEKLKAVVKGEHGETC